MAPNIRVKYLNAGVLKRRGFNKVIPPSATSQAVSAGGSPSAKTFSAFDDPGGLINNYQAVIKNAVGSTSVSGSGLGAYSFSGHANGDGFTLSLNARDSDNNILATATHTVKIGAAASSLYNIDLIKANLSDGSWTLHDPDSLVKSVSWDSTNNRNVITVNALSSGSNAALNWKNGGTREAPRWYKNATVDGNNINRGFFTSGIYRLDFDGTRDMSCDIVAGLARSGAAETAANLSLGGAFGQIVTNSANAVYGVYTYSGATSLSTGGPDFGMINFLHGGNRIGGGVAALVEETNGFDASNNSGISRTSNNQVTSGGQPMVIMVGLGLRIDGTAWDDGDQVKIGVEYLLLRANLP